MENIKNKSTHRKMAIRLIMVIHVLLFMFCLYRLADTYMNYKKASDAYKQIEKQYVKERTEEQEEINKEQEYVNPIDFEGLKKVNSDVLGWIQINALDISYPIVQGKDNDYYLNHTFQKEKHFAGSIFMDCNNQKDFSDQNTIIYGHNMKDGSMFGKLKKMKEINFTTDKNYFFIYTQEKIHKYEIFSCEEVDKDSKIYQMQGKRFSKNEKKDNIITLSTCTANERIRLVIQGRLIKNFW